MNSVVEARGDSWHLHPPIEAPILLSVAVYATGWWKIHQRRPDYFASRHLLCFLAGEILLLVAIASTLHELAEISLMAHMIQHVLFIIVIPTLTLLAASHITYLL